MKQKFAKGVTTAIAAYIMFSVIPRLGIGREATWVMFFIMGLMMTVILRSHQTDPARRRKILIGGILISSTSLLLVVSSLLADRGGEWAFIPLVFVFILLLAGGFLVIPATWPQQQKDIWEQGERANLHGGNTKRIKKKRHL